MLAVVFAAGLAGCRHKTVVTIPMGSHAPIALEIPVAGDAPVEIATLPEPELPPLTVPAARPVPRRRSAPTEKDDSQPASTPSTDAEQAALAIGSLSSGGDTSPQSRQEAQNLIAAIVKRIAALPAKTADARKTQIRQVRNFLDQAQQALNSGDAEGAKNLATKARLLMDDLEKK
jgi:hypothetical protein